MIIELDRTFSNWVSRNGVFEIKLYANWKTLMHCNIII